MTTAQGGYLPVHRWVKHVLSRTPTTVVATIAWAVLCLLVAQRVTPAALAPAGRVCGGCGAGGVGQLSTRPRSAQP
jgi:hypothetical protein